MTDSERPSETVTGVVQGIVTKAADKWVVEVTPEGSQYAKKLWTKSAEQVAAATDLIGQVATFECGVSEYEREGKMVKSLWLNAINPGALPSTTARPTQHTPVEATGSPVTAPEVTGRVQTTVTSPGPSYADPTRVSIERQTSLKAAAGLLAVHPGDGADPAGRTIGWAKRFAAFLETGDDTPIPF